MAVTIHLTVEVQCPRPVSNDQAARDVETICVRALEAAGYEPLAKGASASRS